MFCDALSFIEPCYNYLSKEYFMLANEIGNHRLQLFCTVIPEEIFTLSSNYKILPIYIYIYSRYFEQVSLDIQKLAHLKLFDDKT